MRKKHFFLGVIMVISLLTLVSCGYDFEKKSTELQSLLGDNSVSYEKFMSEYRIFSAKLDEEIEKVDSKFKKTGKLEYSTRLAFLQEYYEDIHVNYIDAMIFKAKKLSGAEATTAAKEIYDSTEWKGPVCTLVSGINGSNTLYSAHYDPSFSSLDIAPLMSILNSYASSYDLTVNRVVDLATDKVASATGASVSSPWGMTLMAYCDATVYLEGYEVFTKNETDEYSVTIGENFTFPNAELEVFDDYGDKNYFIGWTDGYVLYKPEEKVLFDEYTETEYESVFLNLRVGDWNFWDSYNNDGYLAAGESGWIDVTICNDGNWDAEGVTVQLSSETTGVTVSSTTKNYGTIEYEEESNLSTGYSTYNASYTNSSSKYQNFFTVKVDNSVANGTKAKIKVVITDNNGFKWEDTISFTVQKINANLSLSGYYFKDDGNNDGKLNIGETAYLDVCFFNSGTDTAKIKSTQLICETPGVVITKSTGSTYDYSAKTYLTISGDSSSNYDYIDYCYYSSYKDRCFAVKLPNSITEGTLVKLKVRMTDALGNTYDYPIEFEAKKHDIDLQMVDYYFKDDSNQNGELELGEVAYLDICFYNAGKDTAKIQTTELICETPGIMVTKSTGNSSNYSSKQYKTISGDYSSSYSNIDYCYYKDDCFAVRMPSDIAEGTFVKFKVKLTDVLGNVYEYPIEFEAKKQELGVGITFSYDDKYSYEYVYAGENLELYTKVYNNSTASMAHVTVDVSTDSPYVTPSSRSRYFTSAISSKDYGSISWSYSSSDDKSFKIASNTPIGTELNFKVVVSDATGKTKEVTKTFVVGPKSFNPEIIDISASAFDMNGGDKLTAGSYLYIDALFRNVGPYGSERDKNYNYVYYGRGKDVSMKLVSSCPEITILQGNKVIGQSDSGNYYLASRGSWSTSYEDTGYSYMNPNAGFEMKIAADADKTKEYSFTVQVFEGSSLKAEETYTFTLE